MVNDLRSILVVEDQEQVRRFLAQLLEKAGWEVRCASSGSEALDCLVQFRYVLILCDFDLGPGPNGIDLLRSLPAKARGTPFIVLTGHGTVDRCRAALLAGAGDFLEKPCQPAQLLSTIERLAPGSGAGWPDLSVGSGLPTTVENERVRRAIRVAERRFADPTLSVSSC